MSLWGWLQTLASQTLSLGDINSPATESPTVVRWKDELLLCRTLYSGWEAIKDQKQALLPQFPAEEDADYLIRLNRPTFYNAFGRTARALAGTVFKVAPTPVSVPNEITALYEDDIDLQGSEGNAFLLHTFTDALITGLSGILVDMPENTGGKTKLEAQQLDLRPYWTLYRKDDIVSFRVDVVNGKTVLGQLVLREVIEEPAGEFGVKCYERLRVFRRTVDAVTFEAWERGKRKTWEKVKDPGTFGEFRGVTEIPFAPIYTARVDFMDATPPLIDLAHLNLLHYQTNSDMHQAAHKANSPFLFAVGFGADKIVIGANHAVVVEDGKADECKLEWKETLGSAIGQTRSILADIEEQMSNLGLGMLQRKSRAAETADKAKIDKQEQDSTLAGSVSLLEDGVALALYYTAQFLGDPEGKGGRLEFSRDFQLEPGAADRTTNQGGAAPAKDPKKIPEPQPTE